MSYASVADFKLYLRIPSADTEDDAFLQLVLDAASAAIDTACGLTGTGFTTVPAAVKLACEIQASRWFKRNDAPFGVAGSAEMGTELRLLARLDPDVEVLLDSVDILAVGSQTHRQRWGTV